VLYVDLDDFKKINDAHGHAAGDQVLRTVGKLLASRLRSTDSGARLGGDEFAALLPETDAAGARILVNDLTEGMREAGIRMGRDLKCSMGLATFPPPPPNVETVLCFADALMYEVKRGGKGSVMAKSFRETKRESGIGIRDSV
jgi:diguanylate cyclase (GGDEF)-like protein